MTASFPSTAVPPAPEAPAGRLVPPTAPDPAAMKQQAEDLASMPRRLRALVQGLSPAQLDTKYRNWTIRQIVHHLADSHANAYIRWRLALTEDSPRIVPYNETQWSELVDARTGDLEPSLAMIDGLHARWASCIQAMRPEDFNRTYFHPQSNRLVPLWEVLAVYAWHGHHHPAQIAWMRQAHGWG